MRVQGTAGTAGRSCPVLAPKEPLLAASSSVRAPWAQLLTRAAWLRARGTGESPKPACTQTGELGKGLCSTQCLGRALVKEPGVQEQCIPGAW